MDLAWRYMTRFQCVGGDCPDTCCASWGVEVDAASVEVVRRQWGDATAAAAFQPYAPPHQRPDTWGRIRMGDDSRCTLLSGAGRCRIHETLGADLLPKTCASYPRSLSTRHDGSRELAGFLSCPEVARLVLHAEDALVPEPLDASTLGRLHTDQTLPQRGPYFDTLDAVSAALCALGRGRPLTERLWLLARLAVDSAPAFHRTATAPLSEDLLAALADPDHQEVILRTRSRHPRPAAAAVFAAQLRFLAEGNPRHYPRPRRLLWQALGRPPAPWSPLEATLHGPLERYLDHHLRVRWYTEGADLQQHVERLLLKLAVIRVLLTRRVLPGPPPEEALTDAVYAVDRLVEHDPWGLTSLAALRRAGGSPLERLGDLIAFGDDLTP